MKTMAPHAPTSQTSARCKASTPGAAVIDGREPSAVAAYAITHSQSHAVPGERTGKSISVLVLRHKRQRRLEQDVEVEQHRPVLDVIEIELDTLLDLLVGVDFAAPAVDLRPAGDPGLDAVTCEIAVDGLVEQPALQFTLHGVRARPDQRKVALEHDIEQLRQFVETGL